MSHTPGPWIVKTMDGRKNIGIESAEVVRMDNGVNVATVHITAWKQGSRDARQNARLIAAAPDLLDACKYMHKLLFDMGHGGLAGAVIGEAAIAKAEGK